MQTNILCLDLWDKRVWIAKNTGAFAFSHGIVARPEIIHRIKKLLREYPIDTIVVGLPYDLYGNDDTQLKKTLEFIEKLREIFPDIKVIGHDERFSSFLASQSHEGHRDDIAAQHILQSFLDTKR